MSTPTEITKHYAHFWIRDPVLFVNVKTVDVGRNCGAKMRVGTLKSTKQVAVQSVLINKKEYDAGTRVIIDNGQPRIVKGAV